MQTIPRRQTRVWVVLLSATVLVTWAVTLLGLPVNVALTVTILVAGVKATLVAFEFMELRTAPRLIQAIALGWIVAVTGMILAFHLATP
ncbi:caa(3)-type oxidase subunit IV [Propionicimonas paludicola]|uniref:Caa(3)-type oxidase subunit IV n=1 Tax=Propionicimonas paludicola TaxID=185243 RepID=A0A2A9CRH4_9ACTN|nr:cytochrome C oxidase subunit IV family protein [Propionicimonas paludicola]PFG16791.1 caa(3)-type oxidase subunit IV [Propionicimonas paludicola]